MKKENKVLKVASLVGAGALLIGATIGGAIMYNPVDIPSIQNNAFTKGVDSVNVEQIFAEGANSVEPVVEYVNVTEEVEKIVEKEVFVEVDNGDMSWAFQRLEDKEVISDAEEILEELKSEDEALNKAFSFIDDRDELFDLLEDEGIVIDEDDVEIVRVYSDFEDVNVIESNFDNDKYEFQLRYKIEDTDEEVKKYVLATVSVEDGDVELLSVQEE